MSPGKANKNSRDTRCRQLGPNLPQTIAQRPAQRHPDRPPPLRSHQIPADFLAFGFRQFFEPITHRLSTRTSAIKNKWYAEWLRPNRHLHLTSHTVPYNVHAGQAAKIEYLVVF